MKLQSGKFWHEGPHWYMIVGAGDDGRVSQKRRMGPYISIDAGLEALVEWNQELKKEESLHNELIGKKPSKKKGA